MDNMADGKHKIFFLGAKSVDRALGRRLVRESVPEPVYVSIMKIPDPIL